VAVVARILEINHISIILHYLLIGSLTAAPRQRFVQLFFRILHKVSRIQAGHLAENGIWRKESVTFSWTLVQFLLHFLQEILSDVSGIIARKEDCLSLEHVRIIFHISIDLFLDIEVLG